MSCLAMAATLNFESLQKHTTRSSIVSFMTRYAVILKKTSKMWKVKDKWTDRRTPDSGSDELKSVWHCLYIRNYFQKDSIVYVPASKQS